MLILGPIEGTVLKQVYTRVRFGPMPRRCVVVDDGIGAKFCVVARVGLVESSRPTMPMDADPCVG